MAVVQPNINLQESEAERQRRIEDDRLRQVRDQDLQRIFAQFGDLEGLAKLMEGMQAGSDAELLRNAGLVSDADQKLRYSDQDRSEFQGRLTQALADRKAITGRQTAAARSTRLDQAAQGADAAFSGYDDNFYDDYGRKIIDAELPGLRSQFQEARRTGRAQLSDQGLRRSSAANRFISRLAGEQAGAEGALATTAANESQSLRAIIEQRRATARQNALFAAGLQQDVPVEGGTLADLLAGIRGPSTPRLPAVPGVGDVGGPPKPDGKDTLVDDGQVYDLGGRHTELPPVQAAPPPQDELRDNQGHTFEEYNNQFFGNFDDPSYVGPMNPDDWTAMVQQFNAYNANPNPGATPVQAAPSLGTRAASQAAPAGVPAPIAATPGGEKLAGSGQTQQTQPPSLATIGMPKPTKASTKANEPADGIPLPYEIPGALAGLDQLGVM